MAKQESKYSQKLGDPRWQKKRLEVLEAAEWACEVCGYGESTLNVHHKAYFKGREPWEYDIEQLAALCESCHQEFHSREPDILAEVVSRLPLDGSCCRRDVGLILAATLYPTLKTDDEFVTNAMKTFTQLGLDRRLFSVLWEMWGTTYRQMAKEREDNAGKKS